MVREVGDGDTVRLENVIAGATQVRLVGIQAPKLPLGCTGFVAWPLARQSKWALEAMVRGRAVRFRHGRQCLDRHGLLLAHLHVEDKVGGKGLWAHPFYSIRVPGEAGRFIDTFQIVEGIVLDAARVKGRIYLNFGADWCTDFTVSLSAKARRLFEKAGLDFLALKGRRVCARGMDQALQRPPDRRQSPRADRGAVALIPRRTGGPGTILEKRHFGAMTGPV